MKLWDKIVVFGCFVTIAAGVPYVLANVNCSPREWEILRGLGLLGFAVGLIPGVMHLWSRGREKKNKIGDFEIK